MGAAGWADEAELLRAFLAERDVPCPLCGYNLRGLLADRCPECSSAMQISVRPVDPSVGPWLGALAGLIVGAGAFGVGALLLATLSIAYREWPPARVTVPPLLAAMLLTPLALVLARRPGRLWMARRSPEGRRTVLIACWGVTAAMVVGYTLILMRV